MSCGGRKGHVVAGFLAVGSVSLMSEGASGLQFEKAATAGPEDARSLEKRSPEPWPSLCGSTGAIWSITNKSVIREEKAAGSFGIRDPPTRSGSAGGNRFAPL